MASQVLQCVNFDSKVFKMFLNPWDARLNISLVSTWNEYAREKLENEN